VKLWIAALLAFGLAWQSPSYRAEIEAARAKRVADLKADDGWLTVSGLFWLKPGRNIAGTGPGSDIRLPAGAPSRLGVFRLADGHVTFTAGEQANVTIAGRPAHTVSLKPDAEEAGTLATGSLRLLLIKREDRFGIRMRDLNSHARRSFTGLHYFPLSPDARVTASFTAYPEPRTLRIPNVLGQNPEMISPGYVTFTFGGRSLRLEPVYETDERKDLFFIFKDLTSRDSTYPAGRFLHAALPADGSVVLDFNLAYNPPCAFTDFATCPLPPKQNQLPVRIEAGEQAYHGPTR
jgi:uncharacterized protein (DUF1684 family)